MSAESSRHTISGVIWNSLAQALLLPTGLLTVIFLTRSLQPEGYGLYTLAATLVMWIETTIVFPFSQATIKFVSAATDWQAVATSVLRLSLGLGGMAAVLLWLLTPAIATLLHEPRLGHDLQLFAFYFPVSFLLHAHQQILIGREKFRQQAILTAVNWCARLFFIILLVNFGWFVSGAIGGWILATFLCLMIARCYIQPPFWGPLTFPLGQWWSYALPLFFASLSLRLYRKLDLFFLKALGGTAVQVGVYALAQKLTILLVIFNMAFSPILLSRLSCLAGEGKETQAKELARTAMRVVFWELPFAGLGAGIAADTLPLIFGSAYVAGAPILSWQLFAALGLFMSSITTTILIGAGKPNWTLLLNAPLLPLAVLGHLWLIPKWGALGAAMVTTGVAGLSALLGLLMVYYLWRILPAWQTVGRSVLLCCCAYTGAIFWPTPGWFVLLKLLVISVLILLSFILLGEFGPTEIALLRSLVPSLSSDKNNR